MCRFSLSHAKVGMNCMLDHINVELRLNLNLLELGFGISNHGAITFLYNSVGDCAMD